MHKTKEVQGYPTGGWGSFDDTLGFQVLVQVSKLEVRPKFWQWRPILALKSGNGYKLGQFELSSAELESINKAAELTRRGEEV